MLSLITTWTIYFNNYLNNIFDADVKEGGVGNIFNTTKTSGTNIVGGQYIGGNFWAKPDGTGFSQTAPDADGDGIADTEYIFSGNVSTDYLPLVEGSKSNQSAMPVIELNTSGMSTNNAETNNVETNNTQMAANETQPAANETQPAADETQPIADETQPSLTE